jgi:hypothetical protein
MLTARSAINRVQRSLTVGAALNLTMMIAAVSVLLVPVVFSAMGKSVPFDGMLALMVLGAIWIALGLQSMRSSRLVAHSPMLIAAGEFDAAEQHIAGALRSFSIFRMVKLLSLHHLAALRHAQNRWQDAAEICRALLAQRKVSPAGLGKSTRLILADSLLEMGDVNGVGACIGELYQQRLSLGEALNLMLVQLDYESRLSAWSRMMQGAATKVGLAELMPTSKAARTQALLALAARKVGRGDWEDWLRRRVELLIDPTELVVRRPLLKELWLP